MSFSWSLISESCEAEGQVKLRAEDLILNVTPIQNCKDPDNYASLVPYKERGYHWKFQAETTLSSLLVWKLETHQ